MSFNFLHPPPNFDSIIDVASAISVENLAGHPSNVAEIKKKASQDYQKYFTNINSTMEAVYKTVTYTSATTSMQAPGKTVQTPVFNSTSEVNSIQNPVNGMIVYDAEADQFKFREGGAWVVK